MNARLFEEVGHSIDDFAFRELGRSLDSEIGLDFDEDIIHDRNNPEGERGDYRLFYLAHKELIYAILKRRMEKEVESLMLKVLVLLRTWIMKLSKSKPTWNYQHKH